VRLSFPDPVVQRSSFLHFAPAELAKRYQTEGINAYVDLIQNKERELGIDIITHQKWSVPSNLVRPPFPFVFLTLNVGVERITSTEY
jgi:hypothetical protein